MRFREFRTIPESSRGILFRNPGDPFHSTQDPNKKLEFVKAETFPTPKGQYPNPIIFQKNVDQVNQTYPNIQWINTPTKGVLAFAVVTMRDPETNEEVYFGKYFKEILHNMGGKWKNELPGYQLAIKSSQKARSGLKPSDLLDLSQPFESPEQLIGSLKLTDPSLVNGMNMLLEGKLPVFAVDKAMEPAIRDDLGEIIAPIALWQGLIGGDAEKARAFLLQDAPWNSCRIAFSIGKNAGLVDSYMVPAEGARIGISSKGNDGAKASSKNILDGIELLRRTGQEAVLEQFPETVHIMEVIGQQSMIMGPIVLGQEFGFLSEDDTRFILTAIKNGITQVPKGKQYANIQKLMNNMTVTDFLSGYNIGNHALAGLAKMVCNHVNTEIPNFSKACLTFLNSSPLLQIHLYTQATNNGVEVKRFQTIWPPQFTGNLKLEAGKNYFSTKVIGKLAFGYKK